MLQYNIENNGLVENCFQNLRNLINVFEAASIFEKISNETKNDVWNNTWDILSDITPKLKQQLASNQENIENETSAQVRQVGQVEPQITVL